MTTLTANRMPNITWHRLKMNEAEIDLPEREMAPEEAVSVAMPQELRGFEAAFDAALQESGALANWESGMGEAASLWLEDNAARRLVVEVPAYTEVFDTVVVRLSAQDGCNTVACVDVVANEGAQVSIVVHADSAGAGEGAVGTRVRLFAGKNSRVKLDFVQTLGCTWTHLDDFGAFLDDDADVSVRQTVLGAASSYIGFAANLAGERSNAVVDTHYLGHGARHLDFNYVMRQRGAQSTCTLTANGVLMDTSAKVLRGTIDLINGAKGAVGQENETVLLVNDEVRNKTIPIILCDEDDVQGAHGATIGHVNPEQLAYMQTRGLDPEQVEDLFAVASFDYAAANAFNEDVRSSVERLGSTVLGESYASWKED